MRNYIQELRELIPDGDAYNSEYADTLLDAITYIRKLEKDANRYRYLRGADIDAVDKGGIFAGKTPENLVLNGIDLDEQIDALTET